EIDQSGSKNSDLRSKIGKIPIAVLGIAKNHAVRFRQDAGKGGISEQREGFLCRVWPRLPESFLPSAGQKGASAHGGDVFSDVNRAKPAPFARRQSHPPGRMNLTNRQKRYSLWKRMINCHESTILAAQLPIPLSAQVPGLLWIKKRDAVSTPRLFVFL
ncbi:MAG: hypothetical protein MJY46_04975, partial [Bacteroidales bacterium]|nr:hypothetical protein [Bacteroidales bacterium]